LTSMSETEKPRVNGAIPNAVVYHDSPDIALSPRHLQVCGHDLAKLVFGPDFVVARARVPTAARQQLGVSRDTPDKRSRIRAWRASDGR
jgi:hypothetical protein